MSAPVDVLCFSHLRWDFVFQRPQHLMTRCARDRRVFFVQEPQFDAAAEPHLTISQRDGVHVVVPHVPGSDGAAIHGDAATSDAMRGLIDDLLNEYDVRSFVAWYYTPMALRFS